ncbi:hypothetical protein ACJX0J_036907, partial [Zea mays]
MTWHNNAPERLNVGVVVEVVVEIAGLFTLNIDLIVGIEFLSQQLYTNIYIYIYILIFKPQNLAITTGIPMNLTTSKDDENILNRVEMMLRGAIVNAESTEFCGENWGKLQKDQRAPKGSTFKNSDIG